MIGVADFRCPPFSSFGISLSLWVAKSKFHPSPVIQANDSGVGEASFVV